MRHGYRSDLKEPQKHENEPGGSGGEAGKQKRIGDVSREIARGFAVLPRLIGATRELR